MPGKAPSTSWTKGTAMDGCGCLKVNRPATHNPRWIPTIKLFTSKQQHSLLSAETIGQTPRREQKAEDTMRIEVRTSCLKELREKINRNIKQMKIDSSNKAEPRRGTRHPISMNKQSNHNPESTKHRFGEPNI